MEWSGEGLVLGTRRHGEANAILELMTRERGRHLGIVKGGAGTRLRPVLQPGNTVQVTWRARLDEHLGTYTAEIVASRAAMLMASPVALHAINLIGAHLRCLPERDPHPKLHDAALIVLEHASDTALVGALMVRLEVALLEELGFGLDLSECAATGATTELTHVSPKSGRAVSAGAAAPYADRLFRLPALLGGASEARDTDALDGFRLTGFFLERDVWGPRGTPEPEARAGLRAAVARAIEASARS
jgi:DNA repair protein RecO (recombination protein O)